MALIFNDPLNTDPEVFRFAVTEETPLPLKNKGDMLANMWMGSPPPPDVTTN